MPINSYSQPAQAQYINTFVPLPFDQLYALGKEAQSRVDRSIDQMNAQFQKWSEFQSPSEIDMQRWNDLTFGQVNDVVEQMASNPDFIKTAEGRSKLYGKMNNLQYGQLSQLKQGAKSLEDAQKYEQQLLASGKHNLEWHGYNYGKHDTLGDGIYKEERMPYEDIRSLVTPYVDKIQPGHLETKGGYDYFGIDQRRINEALDENYTSLMGTPQAQRHIKSFMDRGMSYEDASKEFYNQARQDAGYKVNIQRSANVYDQALFSNRLAMQRDAAAAQDKYQRDMAVALARKAGSGSSSDDQATASHIQTMTESARSLINRNISANQESFPHTVQMSNTIGELEKRLKTEQDETKRKNIEKSLREAYSLIDTAFNEDMALQYDVLKSDNKSGGTNEERLLRSSNYVLNNITARTDSDSADIILSALGGTQAERLGGKDYFFTSTKGMMSTPEAAVSVIGRNGNKEFKDNKTMDAFNRALYEGKFNNVRVQSADNEYVTYEKNGKKTVAMKLRVSIPTSEYERVIPKGGTLGMGSGRTNTMKAVGARSENLNVTKSTSANTPRQYTNSGFVTLDVYREIPHSAVIHGNIEHKYNTIKQTKAKSDAPYIDERSFGTAGVDIGGDYNFREE